MANLAAYPSVAVVRARVDDAFGVARPTRSGPTRQRAQRSRKLRRHPLLPLRAELVVLDPPRTGAGRGVVDQVAALGPARWPTSPVTPPRWPVTRPTSPDAGYTLAALRAFDAFPMTHHVECVALFERHPR